MSEELQGEVTHWNGTSFGFIRPEKGGGDVFFHITELSPDHRVKRGDRVTYRTAPDQRHPDKLRAVQVWLVLSA